MKSLIVVGGLSGRALYYNQSCNRCLDEMAVSALARHVRASGFEQGTFIADHYDLAGNLRIAFPTSRVMAANYVIEQPAQNTSGQCVLAWNARRNGDAMPRSLRAYLSARGLALPSGGPSYVDASLLRSAGRMDRLAYWVLPNADGNCNPR